MRAVTGWEDFDLEELMEIGERRLIMLRAFNAREGLDRTDDRLPAKFFTPLTGTGPTRGVALDHAVIEGALDEYYRLAGWDATTGNPMPGHDGAAGARLGPVERLPEPVSCVHAGNTGDVMKGNRTMGTGFPGAVRRALLVGTVAILAACSGATPGTASPGAPSAAPATAAPAATPAPTTAASEAASPAASGDLILATTTSTQDSGLLDVLVPAFEATTACKVKTVAVGSGAALKLGEEGNADVLMVHSPAAEKTLVEAGFGVNRQLLMHNMFLVVGPATDPAAISGMTPTKDAFTKIADAKSTFVSRGDGSGTETKELGIWKAAGITPEGDWYVQSGTGHGPHAPDRVREAGLHADGQGDVAGDEGESGPAGDGREGPRPAQHLPRDPGQPGQVARWSMPRAPRRSPTSCSRRRGRR